MKYCLITFTEEILFSVSVGKIWRDSSPKFDYSQNSRSRCFKQDRILHNYKLILVLFSNTYTKLFTSFSVQILFLVWFMDFFLHLTVWTNEIIYCKLLHIGKLVCSYISIKDRINTYFCKYMIYLVAQKICTI